MKNVLILLFLGISLGSLIAQDEEVLKSRKGLEMLPKAGDYALGFDALPLANLALNAIKIGADTGEDAENPGYVSGMNQVIVGKKFLRNDLALRVRFGINTVTASEKTFGDNPLTPSDPDPEVILLSKSSVSESNHFLGIGLERRRGYHRLYGIYGAEALIGYGASKTTNKYEIEFNETAQDSGFVTPGDFRLLSSKDAGAFTFGVRGFVGVEYFVAPKVSVGAEFGWSLGFTTQSRGSNEFEIYGIPPGSTSTVPVSYTEEIEGNSSESELGILVDNGISRFLGSSAAVSVHFHF